MVLRDLGVEGLAGVLFSFLLFCFLYLYVEIDSHAKIMFEWMFRFYFPYKDAGELMIAKAMSVNLLRESEKDLPRAGRSQ